MTTVWHVATYVRTYSRVSPTRFACQAWAGVCTEDKYFESLSVLEKVARATRDDPLLRCLLKRRCLSDEKKAVQETAASQALSAAAAADREAEQERRRARKELEQRAALDDLAAKEALEVAKAEAAKQRAAALEAARLSKEAEEQRRLRMEHARAHAKWQEVDYPLILADRLHSWRKGLTADEVASLRARVAYIARHRDTTKNTLVPHWWSEACPPFTCNLVAVQGPDKRQHMCRCTKGFEWQLYKGMWGEHSRHDPLVMLRRMLEAIVPDCYVLFQQRHQLHLLMHDNDYVVEKTFVHAVWLLSRWLKRGWIPADVGIWEWPPQAPALP